jgi:outer membrane protein OmpA-like peptidoglycan-associated protein
MNTRSILLATALLAGTAGNAAAQGAGTVELGIFGRFTKFDKATGFDDRGGLGGRLGVFVIRNLAVEGDASYTVTYSVADDQVRYAPLHGRLVYNLPVGGHYAFLLGGGYTRNLFRKAYRETANGATGLAGFRFGVGGPLQVRVEVTGDYITNPETKLPQPVAGVTQKDKNWHWAGQAGLSYVFGGARRTEGDDDGDGVPNSLDRCPRTPSGTRVDGTGCAIAAPTPAAAPAPPPPPPADSDGDGVTDALDKCPNTPAGTAVDASGCPLDSDKDGVTDALDKCPNTPAGTAVDGYGCPLDSDHDGVTDVLDRCPNTPPGMAVDGTGCPRDSDKDGVTDDKDRCPNTPAGTVVDAVGCPQLFKEEGKALILEGVNFESGKATLLPESQGTLDRVAESLVGNPGVNVEIGGYTDSRGTRALNIRLSQARADAVKAYLAGKGVAAARMTTKGYGPDSPVASNATAAGRAQNRRVELKRTN